MKLHHVSKKFASVIFWILGTACVSSENHCLWVHKIIENRYLFYINRIHFEKLQANIVVCTPQSIREGRSCRHKLWAVRVEPLDAFYHLVSHCFRLFSMFTDDSSVIRPSIQSKHKHKHTSANLCTGRHNKRGNFVLRLVTLEAKDQIGTRFGRNHRYFILNITS